MKNENFIYYILTILLVGCTGSEKTRYADCSTFSWKDVGNEIKLEGYELNLSDILTRPMRISISDSTLILLNNDNEKMIQLIDLNNEKEIGCYGSFGSGPTDMISPRYVYKKDSVLSIYDSGLLRFNQYIIAGDSILKLKNSIQYTSFFEDVFILSDSILVASVLDLRLKKISFFQRDSLLNTIGDYPSTKDNTFSSEGLAQMEGFSSSFAWNCSKKKIAVAYKLTDLIEIYDENGILESRTHGPDIFYPSKIVKNIGNTQKVTANIGEERDAYFSPIATSKEIYVLYSGRFYRPGEKNYLLDRLFVFDWDGNLLRQYKLDIPIFRFVIDENKQILYGITDSPEFRIVRFNLQ